MANSPNSETPSAPEPKKLRARVLIAVLILLVCVSGIIFRVIDAHFSVMPGTRLNINNSDGQISVAQITPAPDPAQQSVANQSAAQTERPIPYDIPAPIVYTGFGDDVLSIDTPDYPFFFYIDGNSEARHFSVTTYCANGDYGELLVNTTDKYSGFTIDPSFDVSTIEISATGGWEIQIRSIYDTACIVRGTRFATSGDAVLFVRSYGSTAYISGNGGANYFGVWTYGTSDELLVNTTDVYNGTVMIKGDPLLLVVKAVGPWEITLE